MAYTNTNQIGEITEVTGVAKIIRTDGTEETITLGTEVFQGDVVETADGGAVNIGFIDDSEFAVSNNASISIDEFVFDPETEGGVQDFSVARGVFMYTSGLIGRENPDQVEIDTPVGAIGIRGTIIGGNINPDGESQVSVLEGAIVVRNDGGEQLLTNQFETVTLTSRSVAPSNVQQLDASRIANDYGSVKDVSANLFSSLNDQIAQEAVNAGLNSAEQTAQENAEDEIQEEAVEAQSEEMLLEETAPEAETLEESIEDIKTLDTKPELKTIEIKLDKPQMSDGLKNKLAAARQDRLEQDNAIQQQEAPVQQTISFTSINGINEANNGQATTVSGILVGQVTLSNATNVAFQVLGGAGQFTVNANGQVFFTGSHFKDFESNDVFNLGIRAIDLDSGRPPVIRQFKIGVNDITETSLALEDVYDVGTGSLSNVNNDIGVVDIDNDGVRIAKLDVNGPNVATLTDSDFVISGLVGGQNAGNYFDVVQNSGHFYLELKSGFQVVGGKIFDTDLGSFATNPLGTNFDIDITVNGTTQNIDLTAEDVVNVSELTTWNIGTSQNIIIGDNADSDLQLQDDDFSFINGGDGYDQLALKGQTGVFQYNLTGDSLNDQLSSIEQIRFRDADDTLKIDMDSIIRLLKTSNQDYNGNGEFVISTDVTGTNTNGINIVNNSGVATNLIDQGFVDNGTEIRGAGSYEIFTHATHGTVAIETSINGADSGGL